MKALKLEIPIEIIEEILVRLPLGTVTRFKLVSRQWNSLISSPRFIRYLYTYSATESMPPLMLTINHSTAVTLLFNLQTLCDCDSKVSAAAAGAVLQENKYSTGEPMLWTISSYDGLVVSFRCYAGDYDYARELVFWNPCDTTQPIKGFTKSRLVLSNSMLLFPSDARSIFDKAMDNPGLIGLCLDTSTGCHYLVIASWVNITRRSAYEYSRVLMTLVMIYVVGGYSWGTLTNVYCPVRVVLNKVTATSVGGAPFWLLEAVSGRQIMRFDIQEEKLLEVEKPAEFEGKEVISIAALKGNLVVGLDNGPGISDWFVIWEMRRSGDQHYCQRPKVVESWSMVFVVSKGSIPKTYWSSWKLVCLLRNGDLVVCLDKKSFGIYNPVHGSMRLLDLHWLQPEERVIDYNYVRAVENLRENAIFGA